MECHVTKTPAEKEHINGRLKFINYTSYHNFVYTCYNFALRFDINKLLIAHFFFLIYALLIC